MNKSVKTDLKSALEQLKEGVNQANSRLEKDGVIQRFEFTFELVWKSIQEYAKDSGIEVVSPKNSFRVAADLGLIENPRVWFDFLKDRNETTHLYNEEQADEIFSHLPSFITETEKIIKNLEY